ncbi:glycine/D-amino acid oxidase-like deaminating enzyme [Kineococcus radiotolerans]|uniref:Glycine/D-amino acid oxidase-like deaminating enzyme n=1 Tax=Kineococcus radiotolerans TaxID=131568 RepID=A0A7W4XWS0_KINRA|nr:FAD-binding oxidoreductase [Kineococcus radiotolerans]MBB2901203.1 glycine/D-amino acid oxidase-like deaminating enzyme [Kineococcus radiotolerans]
MTSSTARVVVLGGGILGVSTAAHLARSGASVDLVTEAAPASGASGRSLAWLNSAGPRSTAYHSLRTLALDRWRTLAHREDLGHAVRFDGGLTWAAPGASHRERHARELSIGYDSRWLAPGEVARWTPGVDPAAVAEEGAVFNPGEGWADLPTVVAVLLERFRADGGRLRTGAGPARVVVAGGRARGVRTASGEVLDADVVVLATGAAVPRDLARLGVAVPEDTPVALLVETEPVGHALRAVLNTPRVAVRPTPAGTLVLDSGWAEREVVVHGDPLDGRHEVRERTVEGLLAEATRVLAGNPPLRAARRGVGPKPIPGDGEPVVGPVGAVPGLHVLFTHSGATLGVVLGEFTAREVLTGEPVPLLAPFRLERFA